MKNLKASTIYVKKLALLAVFSALAVAIAPFAKFEFLETKANPTQHMINAILGVLLGPFFTAIAAIFIGIIRNMMGVGTVYAFPGGIPGGIIVGVVYWLLQRIRVSERRRLMSAFTEPVGTLLIGAPLSLFLVASWVGSQNFLILIAENGALLAFLFFSAGWALSCVPGSIIGFLVLLGLSKAGISRETLFGEK